MSRWAFQDWQTITLAIRIDYSDQGEAWNKVIQFLLSNWHVEGNTETIDNQLRNEVWNRVIGETIS